MWNGILDRRPTLDETVESRASDRECFEPYLTRSKRGVVSLTRFHSMAQWEFRLEFATKTSDGDGRVVGGPVRSHGTSLLIFGRNGALPYYRASSLTATSGLRLVPHPVSELFRFLERLARGLPRELGRVVLRLVVEAAEGKLTQA